MGPSRMLSRMGTNDPLAEYVRDTDEFRTDALMRADFPGIDYDVEATLQSARDYRRRLALERAASRDGAPNRSKFEQQAPSLMRKHVTAQVKAADPQDLGGTAYSDDAEDVPRMPDEDGEEESTNFSTGRVCNSRKTQRQKERRATRQLMRPSMASRQYTEEHDDWIVEKHREYAAANGVGSKIPRKALLGAWNRSFPEIERTMGALTNYISRSKTLQEKIEEAIR